MKAVNDYTLAGGVLIAASAVLLAVTALTDRGDLTSATLVLAGASCFIAGVFVVTLTRGDPPETGAVSLLPAGDAINVSRMCADLGVQGDAWFIPDGPVVREVIPASDRMPALAPDDPRTWLTGSGGSGVQVVPSGAPLLGYLRESSGLRLPPDSPALGNAVIEVLTDVLEVADEATAVREGESVFVRLRGYRLVSGCLAVRKESPKCCTMHPCPVCSLVACMYASGLSRPVSVTRVDVDPSGTLDLTLLVREEPAA
ncbi:MAG: hypothetical protein LUQ25_01210 [Methanoregulaceae archaeon]|nr:hypothetical protein [Methanoregulaceae archaeon]